MRKMTKEFLETAFAGESMAHMRYLIFSEKAEMEGKSNLARLFAAIAYAEQVHATNHYRELRMIKESPDNLQTCINGETHEVEEMYPAFIAVAEVQEEKSAVRSNNWALEAEKVHAGMYEMARQAVLAGQDAEVGDVHICEVCGWTVEGDAPDRCPLCGAKREKFRKF